MTWDWEKQVTSLIAEVDQLKAELAARGRELRNAVRGAEEMGRVLTEEHGRAEKAEVALADRDRELAETQKALLALAGGYQRDQLPAAIWQAVDAALSAGKGPYTAPTPPTSQELEIWEHLETARQQVRPVIKKEGAI